MLGFFLFFVLHVSGLFGWLNRPKNWDLLVGVFRGFLCVLHCFGDLTWFLFCISVLENGGI